MRCICKYTLNLCGTISQSCNYQKKTAEYNKCRIVTCPLVLCFWDQNEQPYSWIQNKHNIPVSCTVQRLKLFQKQEEKKSQSRNCNTGRRTRWSMILLQTHCLSMLNKIITKDYFRQTLITWIEWTSNLFFFFFFLVERWKALIRFKRYCSNLSFH